MRNGEYPACDEDGWDDSVIFSKETLDKSTIKEFFREGHEKNLGDNENCWIGKSPLKFVMDIQKI